MCYRWTEQVKQGFINSLPSLCDFFFKCFHVSEMIRTVKNTLMKWSVLYYSTSVYHYKEGSRFTCLWLFPVYDKYWSGYLLRLIVQLHDNRLTRNILLNFLLWCHCLIDWSIVFIFLFLQIIVNSKVHLLLQFSMNVLL